MCPSPSPRACRRVPPSLSPQRGDPLTAEDKGAGGLTTERARRATKRAGAGRGRTPAHLRDKESRRGRTGAGAHPCAGA